MAPVALQTPYGTVRVATREQVEQSPAWARCFASHRQDHRYYRIVEDTIHPRFEYGYFVLEDAAGATRAVQPFFLVDQDILEGAAGVLRRAAAAVRQIFPRFLVLRTLMVGCAAGEGHLDGQSPQEAEWVARTLHAALHPYSKTVKASLVVMKEFSAAYRQPMACMSNDGYARVPSFPMTRLGLGHPNFDDFLAGLSKNARKSFRRNLKAAQASWPGRCC